MKKGFTLVEVLITLGIIGIVSVLVVPNTIQSYQKKMYVTRLLRVNNMLQSAVHKYLADHYAQNLSETDLWTSNGDAVARDFLRKYVGVVAFCQDYKDCFATSYTNLKGEEDSNIIEYELEDGCNDRCQGCACAMLETGASIALTSRFPELRTCTATDVAKFGGDEGRTSTLCTGEFRGYGLRHVVVDVNGKAAPNVAGRDIFHFYLYSDGVIGNAHTIRGESAIARMNACPEDSAYESHCFDKIKNSGWVMDY